MREVSVNDVVQLNPEKDMFGGCYLTVTDVYPWGVQGYIEIPGQEGVAYLRVNFQDVELIGQAAWALERKDDEEK